MNINEPLANRIRPSKLDEFIGQSHLVGENKPLRVAIEKRHLFSMIFWGPPGSGKTTLARIYANALDAEFFELSAVSAGKSDVKKVVEFAKEANRPVVLFLDEIHRFNKAQQDFLLPFVERGILTLIGATTENPSFEVIPPLLSRCRVFVLNGLSNEEMLKIVKRCQGELLREYSRTELKMSSDAKSWLIGFSNGDARQAIIMIEGSLKLYQEITVESLKNTLQSKHLRFDKQGEEYYNTISAFIKSMRAGNTDAALYYLARMIDAGQDPLYISRRMVVFASEDVGMAQPTALVVANEVFRACETIGYPECAINLAHGVVYLSTAKKDRSSYDALMLAQSDAKEYGNLPIPLKLRNAPTKLMKDLGYGRGYEKYDKESLLPDELLGRKYYKPKK